MSYIFLIFLSP